MASASPSASVPRATPVHWHYSVPPPVVESTESMGQLAAGQSDSVRLKVREARTRSNRVLDGYAREIENCRFESTLHFDDRDRTRLIGNAQPCQGRYQKLMNEERRSLKQRISELRAPSQNDALFPVVQQKTSE
ncbi:MAG: hypothetical protein AB8B96_16300 [Lysobacterales bacterium]